MTEKTSSRFSDLSPLGEGGMASVFRAYDSKINSLVALKRLHSSLACDETERKRLLREARVCQKLRHANIINVLDVVEQNGELGLVMELVLGDNLRSLMSQKLPYDVAVGFLVQIAEALSYAHKEQVIHRDLKPSNIFVTRDKIVKIGDWGLTRTQEDTSGLTKTGVLLGTPRYMAPEQIKGLELTQAVDMYAFGVMLFEMLTERAPFESKDLATLLREHLERKAPRLRSLLPGVATTLDKLAASLLEKDPKLRPTANETIEVLQKSVKEASRAQSSATLTSFGHKAPDLETKSQLSMLSTPIKIKATFFIILLLLLPLVYFLVSNQSTGTTKKNVNERKEAFRRKAEQRYNRGFRAFLNGSQRMLSNDVKNAAKAIDPLIVMDTIWDYARQIKERYDEIDELDESTGVALISDMGKLYEVTLLFHSVLEPDTPHALVDNMALTLTEAIHVAFLSASRAVIRSEQSDVEKMDLKMMNANLKHQPYKDAIYPPLAEKLHKISQSNTLHPTGDLLLILLNRRLEKDIAIPKLCKTLRKRMDSEIWQKSPISPILIAAVYEKEAEVIRKYCGTNSTAYSSKELREMAEAHATEVIGFITHSLPELKTGLPSEGVDYATLWATAALQNIVRVLLDKKSTKNDKEIAFDLIKKFLIKCKSHPIKLCYVFSYLHHYAARDKDRRQELRKILASFWQDEGWGNLPSVEARLINEGSVLKGIIKDKDAKDGKLTYSVRVSWHNAREQVTNEDGSFHIKIPPQRKREDKRSVQVSVQDYPRKELFVELFCVPIGD